MIEDDFLKLYSNQNTKSAYRSAVYAFLESVYDFKRVGKRVTYEEMDKFEELAKLYFSEKRDYVKDLLKFASSLNDKPPYTAKGYMAGVKEFFIFNNIDISQRESKSIKNKMPKGNARTIELDMDTTTIRTILQHTDLKGKALILTLASSGMRIGEAISVTLKHVDLNSEPPCITIKGTDTKTGYVRYTFISKEAKETLIEWLKVRERYMESAINKNKGLVESGNANIKTIDDRLFPFSDGVVNQLWTNALDKAGLLSIDDDTGRKQLRIHQLRKFFRSQLALGCPLDIVEALMGHEGYLTIAYRRYTKKQMGENYLKNEHLLYVNMPEDVGKIRTEFRQEMDDTNSIVKGLVLENQKLTKQIDDIHTVILEMFHIDLRKSDAMKELEEVKKRNEKGLWIIDKK